MFDTSQLMAASGGGGFYSTTIDGSLRFNDDDSAYLSRTPASAGNLKTWTWSGWVKKAKNGSDGTLFGSGTGATTYDICFFNSNFISNNDCFNLYLGNGSYYLVSSSMYRDPSAWYHVVVTVDSTQATASNRLRAWVNGVQLTSFSSSSYPALNANVCSYWNSTTNQTIGGFTGYSGYYFDGYLAEVNFIDGTALDATSFGEFKSGVWIPKAYSGSYGTNGFYLDFGNSGSIGADVSGNGNNWTANNLAATDVVLDSPTNNFATLNSIVGGSSTTSEGNLRANIAPINGARPSTFAFTTGKWYCEMVPTTISGYFVVGIGAPYSKGWNTSQEYNASCLVLLSHTGAASNNGAYTYSNSTLSSSTYTINDVIGIAVDADAGTIEWYKNGTSVGGVDFDNGGQDIAFLIGNSSGSAYGYGNVNFGQDSSFAGLKTAQGNTDDNGYGDFYYAPPSGYLALCTANLPDPVASIDPAQDGSPQDHFNTVLYTGNGSTQSITGVGFQPDFTWIKSRSNAFVHALYDSVRGATKNLISNNTDSEYTYSTGLNAFNADGFSLGNLSWVNFNTDAFVSWNWKANGSGVSNTDGSITSTVSANTDAGFSIVSYTGTGANATVGHGLNSAPEMIIVKNRDTAYNWVVYSESIPNTQYLVLNSTQAVDTFPMWNNTSPTSSVVNLGYFAWINALNEDHIAYCFHSVDGFSKFGSYTGNGSTNGTFVYTGFRPAYVLVKKTNGGASWVVADSARDINNVVKNALYPDFSAAENPTSGILDFVSNGFKVRNTNADQNTSGGTYIYMAFAENPFKYANAR